MDPYDEENLNEETLIDGLGLDEGDPEEIEHEW